MIMDRAEAHKMLQELWPQRPKIRNKKPQAPAQQTGPALRECTVYSFKPPKPSLTQVACGVGDVLGFKLPQDYLEGIERRIEVDINYGNGKSRRIKDTLWGNPLRYELPILMLAPLTVPVVAYTSVLFSSSGHYSPLKDRIIVKSTDSLLVAHEITHLLAYRNKSPVTKRRLNNEGLAEAVAYEALGRWFGLDTPFLHPHTKRLALTYCMLPERPAMRKCPVELAGVMALYDGVSRYANGLNVAYAERLIKEASNHSAQPYFLGHTKMWLAGRRHGEDTYAKIFRGEIRV